MDQIANRQLDRATFTHYHKPLLAYYDKLKFLTYGPVGWGIGALI